MIFNLKNVELRCQRTKAPSGRGAEVGDRAGGLREQVLGIIIMKMAIMLMMAIITIPIIILIIALFFLMIIFRHLADELAGMLDRLEIEEERSAAVNAAVLGEQEEVEEALKVAEHLYSLQIIPSIFIHVYYSFLIIF